MTAGVGSMRFIVLACIIVVVAAKAGGVFPPFGGRSPPVVWRKGKLTFLEFFRLFRRRW